MRFRGIMNYWFIFVVLFVAILAPEVNAEVLFVDSTNGNDANPGTKVKPLSTLGKAAILVNSNSKSGPTIIKILPGIYNLTQAVVINNSRSYTKKDRLTIEASILPDAPGWKPQFMPIIFSTENPMNPEKPNIITGTYGIQIKVSHVTIRGLKFLGSPVPKNMYAPIERIDKGLEDLLVTQCMFVGDKDSFDIYCPAIATGHKFVVEHCIFHNCHGSAVFWDGPEGISGKNNAMRYCIVDGAYISGVWTCQTADDFEFHHNIITNSEYFWMRKRGDHQRYKIKKCFVIGNKYWSGYGIESGATGQTGNEVSYEQIEVVTNGTLTFETNKRSRNYMHIVEGSTGYDIGAGLFKEK
jgi:hypothetical protein